jgi:hypothetical protein
MNFLFNTNIKRKIDSSNRCLLTLSTCWYILKSKFDSKTYLSWIKNILSIVNNFNLVIYTDKESFKQLINVLDISNKKIKIIIKPIEDFYTYRYKDFWIKNHERSNLNLHSHTDWKLNMLWNEKVFLVNETISNKYFDTLYYGWCDIGYFRNRKNDLHTKHLSRWPNNTKLLNSNFNDSYIHYGCIQNNTITYVKLSNDIKAHYINKLTSQPSIQFEESCFAGGFFILKRQLINIYVRLYDEKLMYYFVNNFIIKDDQTIIMDIIFKNPELFNIHTEDDVRFDNWFMFQRLLL